MTKPKDPFYDESDPVPNAAETEIRPPEEIPSNPLPKKMHPVYLPFEEEWLCNRFVDVGPPKPGHPKPDHLAYYQDSIERWRAFQERIKEPPPPTWKEVKRALQIEKDERFWVVAALIRGAFLQR